MGTFDPDVPSDAVGWELATYIKSQLETIMDTSQLNADLITDFYGQIAVLDAVIDSVGS